MKYNQRAEKIMQAVGHAVVGKDDAVAKILMAILAKGHILLDDIPGVGKTTTALAFSKAMQLEFSRLQFTPDVLPTDVVGFSMYDKESGEFRFQPGAACCNLFLADEINRTSSKTQSALLEVMEEGRITVEGVTRPMPSPYVVIATQNPVGSIGTQMLPESQLDRFIIRLNMGYPDRAGEIEILKRRHDHNPLDTLEPAVQIADILQMQKEVEAVHVDDAIYAYIADLAAATREHPRIELGLSPRGSIALIRMAKAAAYVYGRSYVTPDDVQDVFTDVAAHRVVLSSRAKVNNLTVEQVLADAVGQVDVPPVVKPSEAP